MTTTSESVRESVTQLADDVHAANDRVRAMAYALSPPPAGGYTVPRAVLWRLHHLADQLGACEQASAAVLDELLD
jgi:hypothetical protein